MTPEDYAKEVASCWATRRPGNLPPAAPLSYMAEQTFFHAQYVCHYTGDLASWVRLVVTGAALDTQEGRACVAEEMTRAIRDVKPHPSPPPQLVPPPTAPIAVDNPLAGLEDWLES